MWSAGGCAATSRRPLRPGAAGARVLDPAYPAPRSYGGRSTQRRTSTRTALTPSCHLPEPQPALHYAATALLRLLRANTATRPLSACALGGFFYMQARVMSPPFPSPPSSLVWSSHLNGRADDVLVRPRPVVFHLPRRNHQIVSVCFLQLRLICSVGTHTLPFSPLLTSRRPALHTAHCQGRAGVHTL